MYEEILAVNAGAQSSDAAPVTVRHAVVALMRDLNMPAYSRIQD